MYAIRSYYEALADKEGRELTQAETDRLAALKTELAGQTKVLLSGEEVKVNDRIYYRNNFV